MESRRKEAAPTIRRSRSTFLKGAVSTGLAVAGASILPAVAGRSAHAASTPIDSPQTIFNVAATAEALAVTFYSNGVNNAAAMGLGGTNLDNIKAALLEEQIHYDFFVAQGGIPATTTFSFPHGAITFQRLGLFLETQQMLEGVFDSAFIAAVYEFGAQNLPDAARIACQVAMIEAEHKALGRQIAVEQLGFTYGDPADNQAFAPQLITSVGDAPTVVANAGFLSPVPGNSFSYQHVDFSGPRFADLYRKITFKMPFVMS